MPVTTFGPSRMLCPQCGHDVYADPLVTARHAAYHLDWAANTPRQPGWPPPHTARIDAWRAYAKQLERLTADLRGQLFDARDRVDVLEGELDHINRFGPDDAS